VRRRVGDATRAVAYMRVSTAEQQLGPEAQRARIESWSARAGVAVVSWHLDHGVSGAADLDDRPGLLAALAAVEAQRAGLLVVAARDRLARDAAVAALVARAAQRAGARIVCADGVGNGDSPADALLRTLLDGVAAFERSLIRERTRAALAVRRARGQPTSHPPWGTRVEGGRLVSEPREAEVAARVAALRAQGLTVRAIHARLLAEGVVGRRGRPLAVSSVGVLVQRCAATSADS
jgi:DNA invertase Pin-like site-specific DNA recombinase